MAVEEKISRNVTYQSVPEKAAEVGEVQEEIPPSLLLSTLWLPGIKFISLLVHLRTGSAPQHLRQFARQAN